MNDNNQNDYFQRQIHLILGAMIILTGIVAASFYVQSRHLSSDIDSYRPVHNAAMQSYNQEKSAVDIFVAKLAEYGRAHPDFEPILKKYGIPLPTNAVAPSVSPGSQPAGSPAATPGKPPQSPAPAPKK